MRICIARNCVAPYGISEKESPKDEEIPWPTIDHAAKDRQYSLEAFRCTEYQGDRHDEHPQRISVVALRSVVGENSDLIREGAAARDSTKGDL